MRERAEISTGWWSVFLAHISVSFFSRAETQGSISKDQAERERQRHRERERERERQTDRQRETDRERESERAHIPSRSLSERTESGI